VAQVKASTKLATPIGEFIEKLLLYSTLTFPCCPFFVVISTTPNGALDPYIAEADASLRTDTLSTDSGSTLLILTSTPSTNIKGEAFALIDPNPLIFQED